MKCFYPVTWRGEEGLRHIVEDDFDIQAWTLREAAALVADGFVRLIIEDYVPTRVVGDKRTGRNR